MSIHDRIAERMELAKIYAEDGAFRTAANIFRQLGDELHAHAVHCDGLLAEVGKDKPDGQ